MASLRRFPKSPYFFACFHGPDGRRRQVSTKQSDRTQAMRVALAFERAAAMARRGDATESQLRKILSETLEAVTDGTESLRSIRIRTYFEEWLASKEASQSGATGSRYASTVRQFLEHLGPRADRPLTALRPAEFQCFQDARLAAGIRATTVVVDMKTLATAMHRARRQGLIPTNPVEAIERPSQARQRGHEIFTPAEIDLLLKASEGTEWETLILLGAYTGQRLGDCVRLGWTQLDLIDGTMTLTQQKTGASIKIPLHQRLLAHLVARAGTDRPEKFVCPALAQQPIGGRGGLSGQFIELMGRTGVDSRPERQEGGRVFSRRSFHSLRHTFNTALAEKGVAQEIRMKLTGHRSSRVNDNYTKPGVKNLRDAVDKL